ncbi:MAG: ATP-dependent metallopeptidase HflB, partial [Clostridiales bacterium]|nr:ATP-dependent metallopeptidase HflB [Clostridiales bacterium]
GLICGEDTASLIDNEVLEIINGCYDKAMNLLVENREILNRISDYLYDKETITGKEFMKLFREMKGLPDEDDDGASDRLMGIKADEIEEKDESADETDSEDGSQDDSETSESVEDEQSSSDGSEE